MRKIILILLLLFSINEFAQVTGYMGKRVILMHNSLYCPALEAPSVKKYEGFKMNLTKSLGIEIALSNRNSFCFATSYLLTGVTYKETSYSGYYGNAVHEYGGDTPPAKLSVITYSVALKRFTRKVIAPIGFYLKWEFLFHNYTINYDSDNFYKRDQSSYYDVYVKTDGGSGKVKAMAIGPAFSIGRQRIFFDKMVFNYGVRTSLCVPLPYKLNNYAERSMAANSYDRILSHQFFNLNLGLGFLAF